MIIVAGHLIVDPTQRRAYLEGCVDTVEQARQSPGCLDFSISPDLVNAARIDVFERWQSRQELEDFRQGGPSGEQQAAILDGAVAEYEVDGHPHALLG